MDSPTSWDLISWFISHYQQQVATGRWTSQDDAAKATGLGQRTVSRYLEAVERGQRREMNRRTLEKLASYWRRVQAAGSAKSRAQVIIDAAQSPDGWAGFEGVPPLEERAAAAYRRAVREGLSVAEVEEIHEWFNAQVRSQGRPVPADRAGRK